MSKNVITTIPRKVILGLTLFICFWMALGQTGGSVLAATLPDFETQALNEWPNWVANSGGGQCTSGATSNGSPTTVGRVTGGFTIDQVKTFASEPVTSTWNISNSTVEQWFLKQAGAQATISKYGLNSSNISDITSAVETANVSPAFFYLYTVNEGGGAGGFINHYGSDIPGGGPANAKHDAEYLASQSKDKSAGPATGGGEPSDLPTAEAKQILDALPSGSIGVVYIQATSAVTSELETLSGKTGDWSNNQFGKPLSDAMQNIKTMGGDPQQGGSTISTSAGGCGGGVSITSASCGGSGKYSAIVSSGSSFAGVDQGIDFVPSGSGGFNICAPAPGTITLADQTGHHFDRTSGQAEIIEKLDQTPNAPSSSQYIYYAEIIQINSSINVGTHVNAGDTIGTSSQSPGIEVGWGQSPTEGFMCPIGYPTACGTSFDSWVQGISTGKGP
jgi:hypothetical protein